MILFERSARRTLAGRRREPEAKKAPTLRELAESWKAAHVDVSEGTMQTYDVVFGRLLPRLGDVAGIDLEPRHVAELVAELTEAGSRSRRSGRRSRCLRWFSITTASSRTRPVTRG